MRPAPSGVEGKKPAAGLARVPGPPLRDVTTFRLGGPGRGWAECPDAGALCEALRDLAAAGETPWILGGGSNVLVADAGLEAVVVRYAGGSLDARRIGDEVEVSGCVSLSELAAWTVDEGLEGLVFAAGIPGTVGGGVAGNAGAFGRQLSDSLSGLRVAGQAGQIREAPPEAFGFRYRDSALTGRGRAVVSARFRLCPGDRGALRAERDRILEVRRSRHPDWRRLPTAGSFFRNLDPAPVAGRRQAAGWLLDRVGARGFRVGGAGVFEKHANIIVKREETCTSQDVLELAGRMAEAVRRRFGVLLTPEVRILGRFPPVSGASPDLSCP